MDPQDRKADPRFSLRRWSERKREAARAPTEPAAPVELPPAVPPGVGVETSAAVPGAVSGSAPAAAPELPPIESLTFESDFSAFLQPAVAPSVKQQALKKLFTDPRFNVMDGLDVYIDDYSIPSPLEPELIGQLLHARFTLNPPRTRVNAQGVVEDVPPDEPTPAAAAADDAPASESSDASEPEHAQRAAGADDTSSAELPATIAPAPRQSTER
jgi:hypothetical protein